jgi:hypothetical protein
VLKHVSTVPGGPGRCRAPRRGAARGADWRVRPGAAIAQPSPREPLGTFLVRTVTADLRIRRSEQEAAVELAVEFRSPVFHIPVSVDEGQVGRAEASQWLEPDAFRPFD